MRSAQEVDNVLGLLALGLTDVAVARRTGIPGSTVRDWRHGRIPGEGQGSQAKRCSICDPEGTELPGTAYSYLLGLYLVMSVRYHFSNKSEDIKRIVCENLDALGIHWTRPCDRQIAVYRKECTALLDEFVGPKR